MGIVYSIYLFCTVVVPQSEVARPTYSYSMDRVPAKEQEGMFHISTTIITVFLQSNATATIYAIYSGGRWSRVVFYCLRSRVLWGYRVYCRTVLGSVYSCQPGYSQHAERIGLRLRASGYRTQQGGGAGPADPATAGSMLLYAAWRASSGRDLRGPINSKLFPALSFALIISCFAASAYRRIDRN